MSERISSEESQEALDKMKEFLTSVSRIGQEDWRIKFDPKSPELRLLERALSFGIKEAKGDSITMLKYTHFYISHCLNFGEEP